ncbi:MAG: hypothetical protein MUO92_04685 [Dehalococcoidales bacterium]|nr:hypothetical protein [Dehalococcoidales bacterium]
MKKYAIYILLLVLIVSLLFVFLACGGKAGLGEEFSLSIGQTVTITDEDLEITFVEVSGDNRCARDVVCITAGEVVCLMKITESESSYNIELAQPGLYYDYSQESFGGYKYTFKVEPYPESDKVISIDEYRILLTVSK